MAAGDLARMPGDRRRMLVHTAAAEFAAAGYQRASLNRIIQACGLSKSSFYHVIASKRELFDLVVQDLSAELAALIELPDPDAFAGGDFWFKVHHLLDHLRVASQEHEAFIALGRMFYLSDSPDAGDGASGIPRTLTAIEEWISAVLVVGRESGAVRTDLPVTLQHRLVFAVLGALDEWSVTHAADLPAEQMRALVTAQLSTIRRMLDPAVAWDG